MFSKWFRPAALEPLSVSMAGAKLGDRVLVVGCSDARLIAALAIKTGLSGRTCAVDESPELATEAGRIALKEGGLVETGPSALSALPFERAAFDLVVFRDVLGARDAARVTAVAEAARVLRPGGRGMVIDTVARSGMAGLLGGAALASAESGDEVIAILKGQGFVAVRVLAEREGLRFIEAVSKNS